MLEAMGFEGHANGENELYISMVNRADLLARMLTDLDQSSSIARFDGIGLYSWLLRG